MNFQIAKSEECPKSRFISFLISLYYFRTLLIKTNSPWLITELIKALENKASVLFNLDFANNTISSCFIFFSLTIDL